jgi:hypothetical protein
MPNNNITISRKDVKDMIVRAALKNEEFRESLRANPKLALERALATTLPEDLEVVLLQETDTKVYIVLPTQIPNETSELTDAELEEVAGGFFGVGESSALAGGADALDY